MQQAVRFISPEAELVEPANFVEQARLVQFVRAPAERK